MRISDWSSDVCSSDLLAVSFATPSASCGPLLILAPLAETDAAAELGTRAIPVKRTRFDARWDHVRRAAPAALMQANLRRANAAPGLDEQELLARVNQWVNRALASHGDDRHLHQRDYWETA